MSDLTDTELAPARASLQKRIAELETALREKERALDRILGSRGWRALSFLYGARERMRRLVRIGSTPPGVADSIAGFCPVCGRNTRFDSWEPPTIDCRRNSYVCRSCKSISRNRHLARAILDHLPTEPPSRSLAEFARRTRVKILHTCASGALHETLRNAAGYVVSEFYDGVPSGALVNGVVCQNLEHTTFADGTFDLVVSEDVLEHVSDPERACRELRRILKPGGYHVSTIAVYWDKPRSIRRAALRNGSVEHFLEPVYHGDPHRAEGALVYVDFGADIVERYLSLTGPTEVSWSHQMGLDQRKQGIYDNMVFISRAPLA